MREIIIATQNEGKLKEFNDILNKYNIKCIGLHELNYFDDIVEDGNTFEENALIKAKTIFKLFNKPVIADDSGLCVKALNNEPGIYSARYKNLNTFEEKMNSILNQLECKENKEAYFNATLALVTKDNQYIFEGIMNGHISTEILGDKGFGYDPIFIPKDYNETLAQMGKEEKNKISHRRKAIDKLLELLNENNIFI